MMRIVIIQNLKDNRAISIKCSLECLVLNFNFESWVNQCPGRTGI